MTRKTDCIPPTTHLAALTVLQTAALDRCINTPRQHMLLMGRVPWTSRDLKLLERVRRIRGIGVIETHNGGGTIITIYGTLLPGGFTKVIGDCQK